jgi:APA family basic amino acid/polyamine antiporter
VASGVGTLNGWTLMAGRIPVSAARDGLFFPALARLHPRHGTPHVALLAGTAVTSAMLALYFTRSLLAVFNFVVLLAVLLTLLPHLAAMAAAAALARREAGGLTADGGRRTAVVAGLACVFVLFTIYGVGAEAAAWGAVAMAAGVPVYLLLRRRRGVP